MSVKHYYGNKHVFSSRSNEPYTYLTAGKGETLVIDATIPIIGDTTEILYNKDGVLSTNSKLTYDETNLSTSMTGSIITKSLKGKVSTDDIGQGSLSNEQEIMQTYSSINDFGFEVSVSKSVNYTSATGLSNTSITPQVVGIITEAANIWTESSTPIEQSIPGNDGEVKFSSLNDDAGILVFVNNNTPSGNLYTYTRSGSVWTLANSTTGFCKCVLSGSGASTRMLSHNYTSDFKVHTWNGSSWVLEATLMTNTSASSRNLNYVMDIDSNTILISYASSLKLYEYSGSWSLTSTTSMANILDISIFNNVSVVTNLDGSIKIYEANVLIATFSSNYDTATCNDNFVFAIDETNHSVHVYNKVSNVWTKQVTTYPISYTDVVIKCNNSWVCIGAGADYINYFKISSYTPSIIDYNTVELLSSTNSLKYTATGSHEFIGAANFESITSSSLTSTSISASSISLSGGFTRSDYYMIRYGGAGQSLTAGVEADVVLAGTYGISLSGLSYSDSTKRFTSSSDLVLLINYNITSTFGSNGTLSAYVLASSTPTENRGKSYAYIPSGSVGTACGSCIVKLTNTQYFTVRVTSSINTSISENSTTKASFMNIVRLN